MELTVTKNATCTFCGCVCDDIELHADGERITQDQGAPASSGVAGSRTIPRSGSTPTR